MDSVLISLVCGSCSKEYIVTNGVKFGNCIITNGGAMMNHMKNVHSEYSNSFKKLENHVLNLSCFNIAPFLLRPSNNKNFKNSSLNFGAYIWKCSEIYKDLKNVLISLNGLNISSDHNEKQKFLECLSYFIIIRTDSHEFNFPKFQIKNHYKGQEVLTVHTPYMSISLYKSWSRGTICNMLGSTLILIDSRLTEGCEGAPVFIFNNGEKGPLIALTIWNILSDENGSSGFTLAALLPSILKPNTKFSNFVESLSISKILSETVGEKSIVKVCADEVWGSGIVISEDGVILTCAHVIKYNQNSSSNILVIIGEKSYSSKILFSTEKNMSCELAILMIENTHDKFKPIPLALREAKYGEKVKAIGYNLFSKMKQPCVTSGIISKVTPYFVISTCLVHEGASGGALLDNGGKLVGIITYNLCRNIEKDYVIIPYINFCTSTHSFGNYLIEFLSKRDIHPLVKWSSSVPLDAVEMRSFQMEDITSLTGKL